MKSISGSVVTGGVTQVGGRLSKSRSISLILSLAVLSLLVTATVAPAGTAWTLDGVAVSTAGNSQYDPQVCPDGSGGAIITWHDQRSGNTHIYAQRVNSAGKALWTPNGVAVCTAGGEQYQPQICIDGSGGAIITWYDTRSGYYDIYAQRVNSAGTTLWTPNGVAVCAAGYYQYEPQICPDGSGGAVITWQDYRYGNSYHIYAQGVDSAGTTLWNPNGVAVCTAGNNQYNPQICPDGSGGAVITWQDTRSGDYDVYAQGVDSSGATLWTPNGVAVSTAGNQQYNPQICPDGSGGAIITWQDYRSGNYDVFAQRVASAGTTLWTGDGVAVCPAGNNQDNPQICTDGSGGAIITWQDNRSGYDIYAQRLLSSGAVAPGWTSKGVGIATGPIYQEDPSITSDGSGGAIIAWLQGYGYYMDSRAGSASGSRKGGQGYGVSDIYAQRVVSSGAVATGWTPGGEPVCTAGGGRSAPRIATDGSGGAVAAWQDSRSGGSDIYAQRIRTTTSSWYLAEGSCAWGYETYITIENPNPVEVTARVTYMTPGGPVKPRDIKLPAMSQTTVDPRWDFTYDTDFSTRVECLEDQSIGVDRTMYWTGPGAPSPEAHSSVGVNSPATTWYLAEGSSGFGFECWLLIQNPNPAEATCTVTYMIEGGSPQNFVKKVPANSRMSYNMADDIGQQNASMMIASDLPVVPERAMYRNNRREGHGSIGTTKLSTDYYLAEGTTDYGFTSYVLVQNPNGSPCFVSLIYMTPTGPEPQTPIAMAPYSRMTVRVNDQLPGTDFSTQVHSDKPIVAERAMYWGSGSALGEACHDSIGMSSPHMNFYLPDGQTSDGRQTYTLVQNPNDTEVKVEVSYLTPTGTGNITFQDTIPPQSRRTYTLADKLSSGRAAILVKSKTAGKPIMVERSMYWNNRGVGTSTIGACTY